MQFRFDAGAFDNDAIQRLSADIWADLAFDDAARAALRRDGLILDGIRLTGPSPYRILTDAGGMMVVSVDDGDTAGRLLDLWRLHIMKGLRLHRIAA